MSIKCEDISAHCNCIHNKRQGHTHKKKDPLSEIKYFQEIIIESSQFFHKFSTNAIANAHRYANDFSALSISVVGKISSQLLFNMRKISRTSIVHKRKRSLCCSA